MVNLKINGRDVSVKEGTTILDAAKSIGVPAHFLVAHSALESGWG